MDTSGVIQLISIIVLIFLSGFFSSAETALSTVNRVRMRSLEEEGNKRAARVNKILDNYSKMISTILIGNNIVNLTASSLATTLAMRINLAVGIATGILTIVVLLCGEIVPKTWAVLCSEKLALSYCNIIYLLMQVLTPVIIVVDLLSHGIMKLLHIDPNKKASAMTESELKTYVDVSHEDGVIESEERKLIYNVFDFSDAHAKDIMIPRINMVTVSLDATYDDVLAVFRDSMYTRLPVYEDDKDNIIGLINIKDFILTEDQSAFHVGNILRDAYYTYEYKKIADLMYEMREKTTNVSFVLNEYGATVGMITLEDLLEEIVGEIRDEYDEEEEQIVTDADGSYIIEGQADLEDVEAKLGIEFECEDIDTLSGFMIYKLGKIPDDGENFEVEYKGYIFRTLDVRGRMILKVKVEKTSQEQHA